MTTAGDRKIEGDAFCRRTILAVLARACEGEIENLAKGLEPLPEVADLRAAETGLVMVRGRIGGGGAPFNLGEATATRASIQLATGEIGHGYALGDDREGVRLAAIVDALWQRPSDRARVEQQVLQPIADRLAGEDAKRAAETAATKVNFFTMVRGDD